MERRNSLNLKPHRSEPLNWTLILTVSVLTFAAVAALYL